MHSYILLVALLTPTITSGFGGDEVYYRVDGDTCSQCELGRSLGFCPIALVTSTGGLAAGKCADKGEHLSPCLNVQVASRHTVGPLRAILGEVDGLGVWLICPFIHRTC